MSTTNITYDFSVVFWAPTPEGDTSLGVAHFMDVDVVTKDLILELAANYKGTHKITPPEAVIERITTTAATIRKVNNG